MGIYRDQWTRGLARGRDLVAAHNQSLASLLGDCIQEAPAARPCAREVLDRLWQIGVEAGVVADTSGTSVRL